MATSEELAEQVTRLDGYIASALVDHTSGMTLQSQSRTDFDIELAAAASTELVRAELRVLEHLGATDHVQDILITLGDQYHLIYMPQIDSMRGLFAFLVLDRSRANLALARRFLTQASEIAEL
ncbi:hypothetical protein [Cellulomonas triticagri]|uniref:Roadblock/LC7 domain-containing protein n=1 Tax=Cellulomonas triticagri TaxID=2483352 RepID=A0A3M2JKZ8_9CELL|nr:hypothetical protein [Cellulomonas triticagri]RMI12841.1 hypothetical protein EBM89_06990 [Cellulomonas triticagri]